MSETRDEMLRERVCHWRERISQHPGYWYHEVDTDDLKLFLEALSSLSPAPVQAEGMREAVAWQPIETAPKDGAWILAWLGGIAGCPDTIQWAYGGWWNGSTGHVRSEASPTHWMPLPQAPRPSEGGGADV